MEKDISSGRGFGGLLRQRRLEKGMTIEFLAELTGKSKGYLSLIENGRTKPSAKLVQKLAEMLDADTEEWSFIALEKAHLERTIRQYPTQVGRFFRTVDVPGKPRRQ
jgi:transcriptional regulator with XRE-family HTH domain